MKVKKTIKQILGSLRTRLAGVSAGKGIYIGKNCSLKGKKNIILQDAVVLRPNVQIWTEEGIIKIGAGSEVGERCRISISNSLEIGEKVLLSPNVYITDCDHEYRDIETSVMDQGVVKKKYAVSIGDGSYIGINSVIVGNVQIGKHCIVGANSVVTNSIPDYCLAVGSPAKVIKVYTKEKGWIRYKN